MRVVIQYDPAGPETRVQVNGQTAEKDDIYGFLYPVRRCLLQAWLAPSGSWQGLRRQLEDLARGEALELEFVGRDADYSDLTECLREMPAVTLRQVRRELPDEPERLKAFRERTEDLFTRPVTTEWDGDREVRQTGGELYPDEAAAIAGILDRQAPWLSVIDSETAFRAALRGQDCCLLTQDYLTSFDRLDSARSLTRSMRRADGMIVCELNDRDQLEEYSAYARQSSGCRYLCVLAGDDGWRDALYRKYGQPYQQRLALSRCREAIDRLEALLLQKNALDSQIKTLRKEMAAEDDLAPLYARRSWLRMLERQLPELRSMLEEKP